MGLGFVVLSQTKGIPSIPSQSLCHALFMYNALIVLQGACVPNLATNNKRTRARRRCCNRPNPLLNILLHVRRAQITESLRPRWRELRDGSGVRRAM
ncbi:uncharacterized protein K452DRAFT_291234 [Aplosporella prunicola CBS 121167]|uniref:Uncharacterized protein n=1 Tax=Aplosporella prunicola CBS 121167 TaxID=1176127 RepID=A0A6A6B0Z0_9PEZI|nr:uncharacterized protein K452DRAFT_291234 [Aplosporella prunicola CBS 121167]KAF2137852.1 hypothetical protein K452DRAFT_291234 [Aplosporella prunicola CBS 121167]